MPRRRRSKRLVVDASVAGAAGAAEHALSKTSRDFLQEVLTICHQIVMTPRILAEWKRHRSKVLIHVAELHDREAESCHH